MYSYLATAEEVGMDICRFVGSLLPYLIKQASNFCKKETEKGEKIGKGKKKLNIYRLVSRDDAYLQFMILWVDCQVFAFYRTLRIMNRCLPVPHTPWPSCTGRGGGVAG